LRTLAEGAPPKARPWRRQTELGLLVLAGIAVVFAYVLLALGEHGKVPADLPSFLACVLALGALAHLATRRLAPNADPILLPVAFLLNGLGYVMIARLDSHLAALQAVWTGVGVAVYVGTLAVVKRPRDLARYRYLIGLVGVAALVLPLVPHLGEDINGARLWVRPGPITVQPVEVSKVALAIFFASYFADSRALLASPTVRVGDHLLPDPRVLGPIVLLWGMTMMIMGAERDIGFALLIFVVFFVLLWVASGRRGYLLVGAVLFALSALIAGHFFSQVHVRIQDWLDPWPYFKTTGYQTIEGLFALGSGGLLGTGLGLGHPHLIPVVTSDYIFAAIGEELGLLGTVTILIAVCCLAGAGLRIAARARSDYTKLLGLGLTLLLTLQSVFIMAGIIRLLPLTGLTLPFVAYGGSSLVANYLVLGILARISDDNETGPPSPRRERRRALPRAARRDPGLS
jgi:cell division protein FtsW (lipid II flippase)